MTAWLNHVTIAAPRNGTSSHTVNPASVSSGGTVVSGTLFTPTQGRLLVVVAEGAVTSSTPTGWTLPSGGSAVNNTGLYFWYITAAGGDTFSTSHNGSNYPVVFDIYEFPAGSSVAGVASSTGNNYNGAAGPTLSGLSGSHELLFAGGQATSTSATYTSSWSVGTKLVDTSTGNASSTDGYTYSLAYVDASSATSASSAWTSTNSGFSTERLVAAITVASGGATDQGAAALSSTSSLGAAATDTVPAAAALTSASALVPGGYDPDPVVARSLNQLAIFTGWLKSNGVNGIIGEFGVMNGTDAAHQQQWVNLADAYLTTLRNAGVGALQWAAGRLFSSSDPQAVWTSGASYYGDGLTLEQTNDGPIKASSKLSPNAYGVNLSGAEFFGPISNVNGTALLHDGTTHYSDINPGSNGTDYVYPVASDWTTLAAAGITLVRLPITWERLQPTLNGALSTQAVSDLQGALNAAQAAGVNVILDLHNYAARWIGTSSTAVTVYRLGPATGGTLTHAHLANFWSAMVTQFGSQPNLVGLDIMNEPATWDNANSFVSPSQAVANWKTCSQTVFNAIISAGWTKPIIIEGWYGCPPYDWVNKIGSSAWITGTGASQVYYSAHQYFDAQSDYGPYGGTYHATPGPYTYQTELTPLESAGTFGSASTMSAAETGQAVAAAALSSTSSLSASATRQAAGAAALSSTSSLGATPTDSVPAASALTSTSTMTAVTGTTPSAATLSSTSTLGATGVRSTSGAAALSSTSSLAAAETGTVPTAVALASTTSLSGTSTVQRVGGASLGSTTSLTAAETGQVAGAVALSTSTSLTASEVGTAPAATALSSSSALSGAETGTAYGAAAFASTSSLTASTSGQTSAGATMTSTTSLGASEVGTTPATAALSTGTVLTGGAVDTTPGGGALSSSTSLGAATTGQSAATAALSSSTTLTAAETGAAPGTAALSSLSTLSVAAMAQQAAAASMSALTALVGSGGGSSSSSASWSSSTSLAGVALQQDVGAATLSSSTALSGSRQATATAVAVLVATTALTAAPQSVSQVVSIYRGSMPRRTWAAGIVRRPWSAVIDPSRI